MLPLSCIDCLCLANICTPISPVDWKHLKVWFTPVLNMVLVITIAHGVECSAADCQDQQEQEYQGARISPVISQWTGKWMNILNMAHLLRCSLMVSGPVISRYGVWCFFLLQAVKLPDGKPGITLGDINMRITWHCRGSCSIADEDKIYLIHMD